LIKEHGEETDIIHIKVSVFLNFMASLSFPRQLKFRVFCATDMKQLKHL